MKTFLSKFLPAATFLVLFLAGPAASASAIDWERAAHDACKKIGRTTNECDTALSERNLLDLDFEDPITITKGGTYSGNWRSTSSTKNVITINTSEEVIIRNSVIVGSANLIYGRDVNLKLINNVGYGTGNKVGKFFDLTAHKDLLVKGNVISNLWGMRVSGNDGGSCPLITMDGNLGYNLKDGIERASHFIQLSSGCFSAASLTNNIAVNTPDQSAVEDVISLYDAAANSSRPIMVTGNIIVGAYPPDANNDTYSGGGIIIDGRRETADSQSSNIIIEDNYVFSTTNYGIAIANGHHNTIRNNTIISSGFLTGQMPQAQNVGLYLWDAYKIGESSFYGNRAYNNDIMWLATPYMYGKYRQKRSWLPGCDAGRRECYNAPLSITTDPKEALKIETNLISNLLQSD